DRATCSLDLLPRRLREPVRGHGELLGQLTAAEDLDVDLGVLEQALRDERVWRHVRAGVEASLEVAEIDRLAVRPARADRHRVCRRVAAQLREPHVDRHLAALEPGRQRVRARPALLTLDAAPRIAALARAQAAADALAVLARLRRRQRMEVEL